MPYAPPSAVVGVIRRFRDRSLADPVTNGTLEQIGVSAGNISRTLQALKFLGLLDSEGHITDAFRRLRKANDGEYPDALAEVLRDAYHPIFEHADPGQDDTVIIENAFRGFEPGGQRPRMTTLFLGLCFEAGLVPEDKAPRMQLQPNQQRSTGQRTTSRRRAQPKSQPVEESTRDEAEPKTTSHGYPLVNAIVDQLPKDGRWTQKRRDLWIQAMISAIDLTVEVESETEEVYEGEVVPEHQLES